MTQSRDRVDDSNEPEQSEQRAAEIALNADALHLARRLPEAREAYHRALALDDGLVEAWWGLGCVELGDNAYGAAVQCFQRTLRLGADRAELHFNLAQALFNLGEIDAALDHYRSAAGLPGSTLHRESLKNIACIIPGSPRVDHDAVLHARRAWAGLVDPASSILAPAPQVPASNGKLRIGYCSAFFGARNWMKPVWQMINQHNRAEFELHLFCDGAQPSAEAGYRDHPLDYVHDIRGASNTGLAEYIRRFGIDILVDLNGYSFCERLDLFMLRPASVIVGWFNTFATTGIAAFDYVIGDDAVIPAAEEEFYRERVLRVPGSYLAFSVLYPVPAVAQPPCLSTGALTFGCFGSQYKIIDDVVGSWAAILQRAPRTRLLLKNRALGEASNRAAMLARLTAAGIAADRVTIEGPAEHYDFLAAYNRIDIALDTFPYNGGTTTSEALWQGVPVLAFNGDRWASRTSRTLLRAAGLDDWCVEDCAAYVERAVELAVSPNTPSELATLRATMRERLIRSAACDSTGLSRSLEAIYRAIALPHKR